MYKHRILHAALWAHNTPLSLSETTTLASSGTVEQAANPCQRKCWRNVILRRTIKMDDTRSTFPACSRRLHWSSTEFNTNSQSRHTMSRSTPNLSYRLLFPQHLSSSMSEVNGRRKASNLLSCRPNFEQTSWRHSLCCILF